MPITAKNAQCWKKTETAAPRLSTWAHQRLISFMNERNTGLKRDNIVPNSLIKKYNIKISQ